MDGVPSSKVVHDEDPAVDFPQFTGLDIVEATDGSFFQFSQASHLFHLSFLPDDEKELELGSETPDLARRPDIDSALLEALHGAMVGDLPGPMRVTSTRDERRDIDSAMLEALRRATVADPVARDD
jgi:hypothetical protein